MNLLILGNGFDLAHGLKTTYSHFLEWAYKSNRMSDYNGFHLLDYWKWQIKKGINCSYVINSINYIPIFVEQLFAQYDSWIDLENNIASIIKHWNNPSESDRDITILKLILEKFILPEFEFYIASIINNEKVDKIFNMQYANRVLSFNYSNTFERIYQTKAEICYINGQASLVNSHESHIVFGYDPSNSESANETWCEYDKVFQRVYKRTDIQYKEWIKDENSYSIHIIGHSLGHTDHAFLRPFIMNENNNTTVYYHSSTSKRHLIYQMMQMVGREFLDQHIIKFEPLSKFALNEYIPLDEFLK